MKKTVLILSLILILSLLVSCDKSSSESERLGDKEETSQKEENGKNTKKKTKNNKEQKDVATKKFTEIEEEKVIYDYIEDYDLGNYDLSGNVVLKNEDMYICKDELCELRKYYVDKSKNIQLRLPKIKENTELARKINEDILTVLDDYNEKVNSFSVDYEATIKGNILDIKITKELTISKDKEKSKKTQKKYKFDISGEQLEELSVEG